MFIRPEINNLVDIKKFKTDKEGEVVHYTGISQSACREMAVCIPTPIIPETTGFEIQALLGRINHK